MARSCQAFKQRAIPDPKRGRTGARKADPPALAARALSALQFTHGSPDQRGFRDGCACARMRDIGGRFGGGQIPSSHGHQSAAPTDDRRYSAVAPSASVILRAGGRQYREVEWWSNSCWLLRNRQVEWGRRGRRWQGRSPRQSTVSLGLERLRGPRRSSSELSAMARSGVLSSQTPDEPPLNNCPRRDNSAVARAREGCPDAANIAAGPRCLVT